MKQIWNIFRADWKRLTASVVAVVVMLGLCLVPCLYAWFNILSTCLRIDSINSVKAISLPAAFFNSG